MARHLRTWGTASFIAVVLTALWGTRNLALNRLTATVAVAIVAGVLVARLRWIGVAIGCAFAASVAVWLSVDSVPVYVVVASIGRLAAFAVVAAAAGRLAGTLLVQLQRTFTAR